MKSTDLMNCPFCGSDAKAVNVWKTIFGRSGWHIVCCGCGVRTRNENSSNSAKIRWNSRQSEKPSETSRKYRSTMTMARKMYAMLIENGMTDKQIKISNDAELLKYRGLGHKVLPFVRFLSDENRPICLNCGEYQ